jgi:hypothetical protein
MEDLQAPANHQRRSWQSDRRNLLHRVVIQANPEAEAEIIPLRALDANFNCLNQQGQAPLHRPIMESSIELITTLVRLGADES